jgi:hemerythrin-like domain-containing protein
MSSASPTGMALHAEHMRTLNAMNALESRIAGGSKASPIGPGRPEDRSMVGELIAVVDHDIDRHFRFEEEQLFPLLAQRGLADMVRLLRQEHDAIRPLAMRLRSLAVQAQDSNLDAAAWEQFRYAAMDLIHAVMFHIQKEETGLVRQLSVLLDPAADRDLARLYGADAG